MGDLREIKLCLLGVSSCSLFFSLSLFPISSFTFFFPSSPITLLFSFFSFLQGCGRGQVQPRTPLCVRRLLPIARKHHWVRKGEEREGEDERTHRRRRSDFDDAPFFRSLFSSFFPSFFFFSLIFIGSFFY